MASSADQAGSRRKEFAEHRKPLRADEQRKAGLAAASKTAREAETAAQEAALQANYRAKEAQLTREAARVADERRVRSTTNQVNGLRLWPPFHFLIAIVGREFVSPHITVKV